MDATMARETTKVFRKNLLWQPISIQEKKGNNVDTHKKNVNEKVCVLYVEYSQVERNLL